MRASLLCAGVASCVLGFFVVRHRDVVWNRYCLWRLERARTFEDADPWLGRIDANASRWPRTSEALLQRLGPASPGLTFWFFAWLDADRAHPSALIEPFGRALEKREDLSLYWSHFVRWRLGTEVWSRLDWLAAYFNSQVHLGTWLRSAESLDSGVAASWNIVFGESEAIASLQMYGVLWFLGLSPQYPPRAGILLTRDFLQYSFAHDPKLGRCRAEPREDLLPGFNSFSRRLLVPAVPLPGWEGTVPAIRGPALRNDTDNWQFEVIEWWIKDSPPVLYDGILPPSGG